MNFFSKNASPRKLRIRNPRTGKEDYKIAPPSAETMAKDIADMRAAQPAWAALGPEGRGAVMEEWQARLRENQNAIVAALSADTGRNAIAQSEFFGFLGGIDKWRNMAPGLFSEETRPSAMHPHIQLQSRTSPYPVAGIISPWNFPLLLSFIDANPALMAGCAAYIKPSEVTPRFAEPVAETIEKVSELREVLKIVPGDGETGANLVPLVDVVAFTGSVATGRKVGEAAAKAFIPAFLELGGKDPAVVLESADIDRATTALLRGSIAATGQACQSLERIYVQRPVFDEFVEKLTAKAEAVDLAYPDPDSGVTGPLIFGRQADIIGAHLEDAVAKGATVKTGGEILDHGGGKWIRPTVLTDVNHDMKVMTEETFGPVMPVMPFDTVEDGIALANDTDYGLSACVFAGDEAEAIAVGEELNAGAVSINDAGLTTMIHEIENDARGFSGAGASRHGPSGLLRFLQRKALMINQGDVVPIEAFQEGGKN